MSKVVDEVMKMLPPYAEQCGVEIVEVEYKKGYNGMELTVYIDKDAEGGVSLNDCEALHRLIDEPLDVLDPTAGAAYTLNVSSPGLDRPLKTERDYRKNLDKEVQISLFQKIDLGKKFVAILKGYDLTAGKITVEANGKTLELDVQNIALIKPEIRF